jgi:bidirectional [NiFe] hydrogenase diaphorase subunit
MDLGDLRQIAEQETAARRPTQIRVCTASGCLSSRAEAVRQEVASAVAETGLADREVRAVGCMRLCGAGPLVRVDPDGRPHPRGRPQPAGSGNPRLRPVPVLLDPRGRHDADARAGHRS